jgi:hypothetical protein
MIIASFWRLCHGSNRKTARRFLLPYSVINFILSVFFVTSVMIFFFGSEEFRQIDPQSLFVSPDCSSLHMMFAVTLNLLILLNDALFVRDLLFVLVPHADNS